MTETLKWIGQIDGYLQIIDQRKLPGELIMLDCRSIEVVYDAIKTLAVRGAPAIGVAAGYGAVIGIQKLDANASLDDCLNALNESCNYLAESRPTAVNLFYALDRVKQAAKDFVTENKSASVEQLCKTVLQEAHDICNEDKQMCRKIGSNGEKFIKAGFGILTHCNAGALATAGQGTALSVMYEAHKNGKKFKVYCDETRPLLQGARLTSWELKRAGIDTTVICDNMAGWLMRQGKIDAVITGADRIAANGDSANKIGTYSLSILAKHHNIPFYIAAPSSTFDLTIDSGTQIPIEERSADEVTEFAGVRTAAENVDVYNPAFDVVEADDIAAIITEKGVIERPDKKKIAGQLT